MVRGILIRQLFLLLNMFIIILCIVMGAVVGYRILRPERSQTLTLAATGPVSSGLSRYPTVQGRSAYDALISSGLFGEAGRYDATKVVAPTKVHEGPGDPEETDLNLKLRGAIAQTDPASPFASAIIENLENRSGGTLGYSVGDTILDQVILEEIYPRKVILLNSRKSPAERQRLSMFEVEEAGAPVNRSPRSTFAPSRSTIPTSTAAYERITLNRADIARDIQENYANLISTVKPRVETDASGNVLGITADDIGDIPLAKKLGIQEGDVLSSINNEKIDNVMAIPGVMQKYANASSVRIGILRDGKMKTITYRLQ